MAAYTFICVGHDGAVAAIDAADCADDAEARLAVRRLFREFPHLRKRPGGQNIEVYEGGRLVHHERI